MDRKPARDLHEVMLEITLDDVRVEVFQSGEGEATDKDHALAEVEPEPQVEPTPGKKDGKKGKPRKAVKK
jgi:hypothetical protein